MLSLVASQDKDSKIIYQLGKFTYTKWALEAFVIANAEKYDILLAFIFFKNHESKWSAPNNSVYESLEQI